MARPLDWQLKVEDEILEELRKILEQSVSEIEKELAEPLSGGVGEALSRAQAQAIAKAARSHLNEDWPEIRRVLSGARESSADAAVRAFYEQVEEPLKTLLGGNGYDSLVNAQAAMASDRINTVVARLTSSKRSLSEQVWQTRAMTNGWLNSKVNQALARGWDARRLADEVVSFVNPNVPGGASYAARRLARSEINNAFHAQTVQQMMNSGVVEYAKWNLSRSHPDRDICDDLAERKLGEDIPGLKSPEDSGDGTSIQDRYDRLAEDARRDASKGIDEEELEWMSKPGREKMLEDTLSRVQNERLQREFGMFMSKHPDATIDLAEYFNNDNSFLINEEMRNGVVSDIAKKLQEAMRIWTLPETTRVHRGVWDMDLPDDLTGALWTDKAFQSTTLSAGRAEAWAAIRGREITVLDMIVPRGTNVALDPNQEELAIPDGMSWRIVEDVRQEGSTGSIIRILRGYLENG